ncbi:hypothetical protein [Bradyrhizobium sp. RD5-C2]|nr:hypothetical protein [Bradyrhizobium sp. RD5-C2]GIQ76479.1 hypothetical protein BraRD5C2_49250 [Bradyrhizobium sp. RD5-C2]
MFEKLAKFRPFEPRQIPPRAATYSNDNQPVFAARRTAGVQPRPVIGS